MILIVAFLAALVIALLSGGSLRYLAKIEFKAGWVALVAFAVQLGIIYFVAGPVGRWSVYGLALLGSYVVLMVFVFLNRRLPGLYIIGLGLLLNFIVMLANGGFMPVSPSALESAGFSCLVDEPAEWVKVRHAKDVLLRRENTRLWWLSDVFVLAPPAPVPSVFSPGDVLVGAGVFVFIFKATRRETDVQTHSSRVGGKSPY